MTTPPDRLRDALWRAGSVFPDAELSALSAVYRGPDLEEAVRRRCAGDLVEHLTGRTEFCGLELAIAAPVFVPRPRAAALVRVATTMLSELSTAPVTRPLRVLDLGCGCGALAAALTAPRAGAVRTERRLRVLAVDAEPTAVACAVTNGQRYGFAALRSDWLADVPGDSLPLDLVVAYLPHVPDHELERRPRDLARAEPLASVAGGRDGLTPLRTVLPQLVERLSGTGAFVTLLHESQVPAAETAVAGAGLRSRTVAGDERGDVVLVVARAGAETAADCTP